MKAPLAAQHAREQRLAPAGPYRTNAVVRAHERRPAEVLHDGSERLEVGLAERLLGEPRVDAVAIDVGLPVVEGKVLHVAVHARVTRAGHDVSAGLSHKERVLGVVLVVAAAKGRAVEVRARRIPAGEPALRRLLPAGKPHLPCKLRVPGLREHDGAGKTGPRVGRHEAPDLRRTVKLSRLGGLPHRGERGGAGVRVGHQLLHLGNGELVEKGVPLRVVVV